MLVGIIINNIGLKMNSRYSYSVVCSSNMNRSMDAHCVLKQKKFRVESYGTGTRVKLPGPTATTPNVYAFGTTYKYMFDDLEVKDAKRYKHNKVLDILSRNMKCKASPEKFAETGKRFDVIITCEERVFDQALEQIDENWRADDMQTVHIINVNIRDTFQEAEKASKDILYLCQLIEKSEELSNEMENIIKMFAQNKKRKVLHTIAFY